MSINFHGYVLEGRHWTWPPSYRASIDRDIIPPPGSPELEAWMRLEHDAPANPLHDPRLEVSMCNANATDVLESVGLWPKHPPIAIPVFRRLLEQALESRHPDSYPELHERVITVSRGRAGGDMDSASDLDDPLIRAMVETGQSFALVRSGRSADYIPRRISQLIVFADAAEEHGATHVGWG